MQKILLVEDEIPIVRLLKAYLEREDYQVIHAEDGILALEKYKQFHPSLVILDLMIPELDGWQVLAEIRKISSCPVIIVTARGEVKDKLFGFEHGADDYISKPFDPEEVVARVKAVLRRPQQFINGEIIQLGSLTIDIASCSVSLQGTNVLFAPRDWEVFAFLVQNPNQVFTREQLLDNVWGMDYDGNDRAVDVSIKRIRQALQEWPEQEGEIVTIRRAGYMLRV